MRGERDDFSEERHPGHLLRNRDLEVMAWYGLVVGQRTHAKLRVQLHRPKVYIEDAGLRSVERRRVVVGTRCIGLPEELHSLDLHPHLGAQDEQAAKVPVDIIDDSLEVVEDLLSPVVRFRIEKARIQAQRGNAGPDILRRNPLRIQNRAHLRLECRDLGEPELMDLIRRHVRAGMVPEKLPVVRGAVG